jgi:hypothetical protein
LADAAFAFFDDEEDKNRFRRWCFDLNLLAYHSNDIDLSGNEKALDGSYESKKGTKFLEFLEVSSKFLWQRVKHAHSVEVGKAVEEETSVEILEESEATRPTFRGIKFSSTDSRDEMKQMFFTHAGRFRPDLRQSLLFGPTHGFIRFEYCETQDVRYFIPVTRLSEKEYGRFLVVCCVI